MPNIDQAIGMMRNRLGRNVPGVEPPPGFQPQPPPTMTDDMGGQPPVRPWEPGGGGFGPPQMAGGEMPPAMLPNGAMPPVRPYTGRQDLSGAVNGTITGQHGGTQQLGAAAMRRLPQPPAPPSGPIMDPREISQLTDMQSINIPFDPNGGMTYDVNRDGRSGPGQPMYGQMGGTVGADAAMRQMSDFGPPQQPGDSSMYDQPQAPFTTDIATARRRVPPAVGIGGAGGPTGGAPKPGMPAVPPMGATGTAVSKPAAMAPSMPGIDNKLRRRPVGGGGAMQRRKQVNRRMGGVLQQYGGLK